MNDFIKILLSLSASGSVLILSMFLLKATVMRKLSRNCQYYLWLIVIARLLIPFSPEINLMNQGIHVLDEQSGIETSKQTQGNSSTVTDPDNMSGQSYDDHDWEQVVELNTTNVNSTVTASDNEIDWNFWAEVMIIAVWAGAATIIFLHKVRIYHSFTRYIKKYSIQVTDIEYLEILGKTMDQMNIRHTAGLYINSKVASPMLIGFFKCKIILPSLDLSQDDFRYTIIHELTHYKKKDMFYKWLVQLTVCIHWYNPLVYLMTREIGHSCELACDEAVVNNMDEENRISYGDMLLNAARPIVTIQNSLAAITLIDNKKILKERLKAIMNKKQKNIITVVVAVCLTAGLCTGSFFLGTYHASADESDAETTIETTVQEETTEQVNTTSQDDDYSDWHGSDEVNIENDHITSYETGIYKDKFVFRIKLTESGSSYSTKSVVDGTTVYFSDDCGQFAEKDAVIDALKDLIPELKSNAKYSDLAVNGSINILKCTYIGDDVDSAFASCYANDDLDTIGTLVPYISDEVKMEYIEKAYQNDDIGLFAIMEEELSESEVDTYVKKAYEDDKINFFAVAANDISDSTLQELKEKAADDGKSDFLAILYSDYLN